MIRYFKIILTSLTLIFLLSLQSQAQCDTYAGTIRQGSTLFCMSPNNDFPTSYNWLGGFGNLYLDDMVLDANDTLLFYITDRDGPINGQVIGSAGFEEDIPIPIGSIELDSFYRLYAVAGNNDGNGGLDFTDSCLSVTSGWGLRYSRTPPDVIEENVQVQLSCDGEVVLDARGAIFGDPSDYTYFWIPSGETTPDIIVTEPGFYSVDIINDAYVCPMINSFDVLPYTAPTFTFDPIDSISCIEDTMQLRVSPQFSIGDWTGRWLDQGNNVISTDTFATSVNRPGTYYFEITFLTGQEAGCTETYAIDVPASAEGCALIQGKVVRDQDNECDFDPSEPGLPDRLIQFEGTTTTRYAITDAAGNYEIYFPANLDAQASIVSQHFLYQNCQVSWLIPGINVGDTTTSSVAQTTIDDCPLLEVQLSAGITRRCFTVPFDVDYCNSGNLAADSAYIIITLDEHFMIDSSALSYVDLGNDQYRFDLGSVPADSCNSFTFFTTMSCDAVLGETVCSEARIFPDAPCPSPGSAWSEASVAVSGDCDGLENIFTISNIGNQIMPDNGQYIVIEDGVMITLAPENFLLPSGEGIEVKFPANGKTYRLEATQVADHPGMSMPSFTIEGCGGFGSTGFVNQFPQDDLDPFVDIECREVIGSYDPNDKTAFPAGYSDEHFIDKDQQLEYLIRFQNTGTDTAFTVMIQDVLDPNLDITTFRPKAASHPYEVVILENDSIQFVFNDILLPDSSTNLIESNGYIRFTISPEPGIELGTVIKNQAAIFFDFNEPIITNEVFHTIGEDFVLLTDVTSLDRIQPEVINYPNPTKGQWFLKVNNWTGQERLDLVLTDALGRIITREIVDDDGVNLDVSDYSSGVYFWKLESSRGIESSGRLIRL